MSTPSKKWKASYDKNRKYNSKWEKTYLWVQRAHDGTESAYCKLCHCTVLPKTNNLDAHEKTKKHKQKAPLNDYIYKKSEIDDSELLDYEEFDQNLTNVQKESSSPNYHPQTKELKITTPGIERQTIDDAIGNFYKTINSSFEVPNSNFDNSDDSFARYLGNELKNIKNISIKKKLKLKILNMVLNTEDSADEINSQRPFPIFVSTSGNISFPKVISKSPELKDDS